LDLIPLFFEEWMSFVFTSFSSSFGYLLILSLGQYPKEEEKEGKKKITFLKKYI